MKKIFPTCIDISVDRRNELIWKKVAMKELLSNSIEIFFYFGLSLCLFTTAQAQPFIDLLGVRAINSPDAGILNHNKIPVILNYLSINTSIPINLGKGKDAVIISPFAEKWMVKSPGQKDSSQSYCGLGLPISFIKTLYNNKWSLQSTLILRVNTESFNRKRVLQTGGQILLNYKARENLTYQFGLYVNGELFGLFILPRVGIDWKINNATNLFGLLPGNLNFEYRMNNDFYCGLIIRTNTNSYADVKTIYWRINENQAGVYLDSYLTKNIVLNAEAGYSMMRRLTSGSYQQQEPYRWNVNDNFYVKLMLVYRIRLR